MSRTVVGENTTMAAGPTSAFCDSAWYVGRSVQVQCKLTAKYLDKYAASDGGFYTFERAVLPLCLYYQCEPVSY